MSECSTRLIIVEDESLLRDLLKTTLARNPEVVVVGTYSDGQKAYEDFERTMPNVALLDIQLGSGWTGIETGIRLRESNPELGIVLLSNYASPDILETIPDGTIAGWSYLLKKSLNNSQTLIRAIQGSRDRLVVLDPDLIKAVRHQRYSVINQLTSRQLDILSLVSQGYTNAAIAKTLFLSEKSIENQLTGIYSTLNITSSNSQEHARVKAVLAYLGNDPRPNPSSV